MLRSLAGLALLAAGPTFAQGQTPLAGLVSHYRDWAIDRGPAVDLTAIDLDLARRELGRMDPSAIPVDPVWTADEAREMRRRVLTSFALELAALGSTRHAASAARLVEWACAYVRTHAPLNDFDRAWQMAALSVIEGGIDSRALADHVAHAQALLPGEPRLLLARGIVEEQVDAPGEGLARTDTAPGRRARDGAARAKGEPVAAERAIALFREAAREDTIAAEALLRAGHVQLRLGRYDAALATWHGLENRTADPALRFLLYLFRGIAYESRARIDEARQSYKAALAVSPGAHSATLRLAVLAFRNGHDDNQTALVGALLRDDDPRRDPWWSYYAGDWRFWYERIGRVRAFLRTP